MTALEILKKAREIVAHPGWWTKGYFCDSKRGQVCALGAIGVACGAIPVSFNKKGNPEYDIAAYMDKFSPEGFYETDQGDMTEWFVHDASNGEFDAIMCLESVIEGPIDEFNDAHSTTQEDVVKMFDRAIEKASK